MLWLSDCLGDRKKLLGGQGPAECECCVPCRARVQTARRHTAPDRPVYIGLGTCPVNDLAKMEVASQLARQQLTDTAGIKCAILWIAGNQ